MSKTDTLAASFALSCQKWTFCAVHSQNHVKTDTLAALLPKSCQKWTPWPLRGQKRTPSLLRFKNHVQNGHRGYFVIKNGHLISQNNVKNGHLFCFLSKFMSKMDTVAALRPKLCQKMDTLAASRLKLCQKRTLWPLRGQNHVKIGHLGRFAAKTHPKMDRPLRGHKP